MFPVQSDGRRQAAAIGATLPRGEGVSLSTLQRGRPLSDNDSNTTQRNGVCGAAGLGGR